MNDASPAVVKCGTHGDRVAAVVCSHLLEARERHVGFVENSADPADLQAWCEACERLFLEEQGLTAAFREFTRMRVVCDFCYAAIKEHQASMRMRAYRGRP